MIINGKRGTSRYKFSSAIVGVIQVIAEKVVLRY
jgi:hypothetical protein